MKPSVPIYRLKRTARLLARATAVPLHKALDDVAEKQGYKSWSHLSAATRPRSARDMLRRFVRGDLVLLGGRPGNGKTLLGLDLAIEAARGNRSALIFSLEDSEQTIIRRLRARGADQALIDHSITIDTSDGICASHIVTQMENRRDAIILIDYLQLLDQRRENPPVSEQLPMLKAHAIRTGAIILALSQIDRAIDMSGRLLPERADVRMPNPFDVSLFAKACFVMNGEAYLE